MEAFLLTVYVLIWPLIVAGVLWVICSAFYKEWSEAKKAGRRMI